MRRIKTKFNPHREQRAGYAWAMDTIEFKVRSEEGHKYLIVLRCLATGAFHYIPLFLKSDAGKHLPLLKRGENQKVR